MPTPLLRLLIFGWLVIWCGGGSLAAETAPERIDAGAIEVTLVPDKAKVMLGEPLYLSYVVRNKSPEALQVIIGGDYRNELGRPESFTVVTRDADGHPVPQPSIQMNMGGISGPQRIPPAGTYAFRLFLPHWATIDKTGRYAITAKRTLNLSVAPAKPGDEGSRKTDLPSEAHSEIEVIPLDPAALGKIIEDLGTQWRAQAHHADTQEPGIALLSIHDERVIPQFLQALRIDDYELKFIALEALSKFNSDAALDGLRAGMKTTGADIGSSTTTAVADQMAANIRHAAALALSRSPHPDALKILLEQRKDASSAVRHTVVLALASRVDKKQAIALLREMRNDPDEMVRKEANYYFEQLSQQP
jgi:hypothetical protein